LVKLKHRKRSNDCKNKKSDQKKKKKKVGPVNTWQKELQPYHNLHQTVKSKQVGKQATCGTEEEKPFGDLRKHEDLLVFWRCSKINTKQKPANVDKRKMQKKKKRPEGNPS